MQKSGDFCRSTKKQEFLIYFKFFLSGIFFEEFWSRWADFSELNKGNLHNTSPFSEEHFDKLDVRRGGRAKRKPSMFAAECRKQEFSAGLMRRSCPLSADPPVAENAMHIPQCQYMPVLDSGISDGSKNLK